VSWIQKLHETYELCYGAPQFETKPLLPVGHTEQQAHIEIVLDQDGNFQRAGLVRKETTVVPATEDSAGRTNTPAPHPLCDKIQYCAADYKDFGGAKDPFFKEYIEKLRDWQTHEPHPKVQAILTYVQKASVVGDLVQAGVLYCGSDVKLLTEWISDAPTPELFKMLQRDPKNGRRDQGNAFVRWRVQVPGDPASAVWEDQSIRDSWIRFETSGEKERGLCMVTGKTTALAANHPRRLRHGGDGAKLISSNDRSGFTFRGRVESAGQVYGVGTEVTQKAHNALRWLIGRQGYYDKTSGQVFVAWSVRGADIPDPLKDTARLFEDAGVVTAEPVPEYAGDAGQLFALGLGKMISGYRAKLGDAAEVVVLGLDSATPGRMAIIYYRELTSAEFLERVNEWHFRFAWPQNYARDRRFVGSPAPREIAEAAYGLGVGNKLRKATVERLLPCIVDGRPVPADLVRASEHRACNRAGMENWEWEKSLGIACALIRGSKREEDYQMSLEENRTTRDYLFGRLLAIAEDIEQRALYLAKEERDTTAAKLMPRFAERPCSTWRNIVLALVPYKTRLRANRPGLLVKREKLLDKVSEMFGPEDFTSDRKLSGEFLLGYHCQRAALWQKSTQEDRGAGNVETENQGEEV
jgi:CRISPR-associated protein Csd1